MKKARKKKFDKGTEARRAARNSGIAPANTRVIEDKSKRAPKHKKKWLERAIPREQRNQNFSAFASGSTEPSFWILNQGVGGHGFVGPE